MPIQRIEQQIELPVLGRIRLGVRKTTEKGTSYPTTVEHFVLTDAPEVEKVYGPDPKELDIMFPSDDFEVIMPTWLKWYGEGVRDKEGNVIGGKLLCYGDGPKTDGTPGKAHYLAKRDPVTRVVPCRDCLAELCPDWKNGKGQQQCKQTMQVFCMLPRVSHYGVYRIDTTSWASIRSFKSQLDWVKSFNRGIVKAMAFKIVREETPTKFFDKDGNEKMGRQYIMYLKPNEEFGQKWGMDVQKKLEATFNAGKTFMLPSGEAAIEAPMEDHYPVIEGSAAQSLPAAAQAPDPVMVAEALIADPEVSSLFDQLEKWSGKQFAKKSRIISVRKKEGEADQKQAVMKTLREAIASESAKKAPPAQSAGDAAAAMAATAIPTATQPKVEDTSGIL